MSDEEMASPQSPSKVFHCLIFSISFVVIVPILCIALALGLPPGGELSYTRDSDLKDINRTIYLMADLISVDIPNAAMVMDWLIYLDTCEVNCTDVNIFFDTNFFSSDHSDDHNPYNTNIPTDPIFKWNASYPIDPDLRRNIPIFSTKLIVLPDDDDSFAHRRSIVYYPFDSYGAFIVAFAQEAATNKSVSVSIISATGRVVGLNIIAEIIEKDLTHWEAGTFLQEPIVVFLTFKRSTLVIVYCLMVTLTFWLVTLMICLVMIATVVFGFRQRNEIFVVPIGTVFAFTQLRSTMPEAPEDFDNPGGILDFAGLLPCLILLSISSVSMVGVYLFANPDDPSRRALTWSELENVLHHYIQHVWITAEEWVWRVRFRIMIAKRIMRPPYNIEIPLADTAHENPA
ncbi:hypothetical protein EV421DRAFT_1914914 [Armillaria borealis]|uniref:Transmembrane protein n=1 Tax=Armillaria borealis TaxID=47425 RepID=A0AA39M632_9AGAR|nr:hypothetical protein EV421DRAFT_1914914 [Armillaria borealis]